MTVISTPETEDVTLVFPAGMPQARQYSQGARRAGQRVLGASSMAFDPAAGEYDEWERLPYVHEPEFAGAFAEILRRRKVTAVYSPHQVVSDVLQDLLPTMAPAVRLLSDGPLLQSEAQHRRDLAEATAASHNSFSVWPSLRPPLTPIARAGITRLVGTIAGMTDCDKIDAIIDVMRGVTSGDVVEIGSWWGRSAALLLLLAQHYAVGPVLCIDPWQAEYLGQNVPVLDRSSARLDAEAAFATFQVNLAPLARGQLNYLRATSAAAAPLYRPGLTVTSETFGTTTYSGRVALLHIDGNHGYEQVALDAASWIPHVGPGGWIVFDDYVWAFGDGPRRVADAFLSRNADRIATSFLMGTALFIRLADA